MLQMQSEHPLCACARPSPSPWGTPSFEAADWLESSLGAADIDDRRQHQAGNARLNVFVLQVVKLCCVSQPR